MRILIAEDDAELADGLTQALRQSGHAVDRVRDGLLADRALASTPFELLILDLGLPELDGFEVLKRLRLRRNDVMVLILTAEDDVDSRIRGLDLGADDFLTKPFALGELEARIRALARRGQGGSAARAQCGALVLDSAGQRIYADNEPIELTRAEFMVLATLIERCGKVVSKSQLFERLYDWEANANQSAVEVYISRVRKKIEPAGASVRVVRGLGYLLEQGPSVTES